MPATKEGSIGLWAAVAIGVGGMVGAGIFSILGVAAETSGTAVYVSFIIAGVVALLCAYSYAKLGVAYPSAGGPIEFLVRGYGGGVLSGGFNLLLWAGYILALALYARAFGGYAVTFLPAGSPAILVNVFATAIILIFAGVNLVGAKAVGRSEIVIVGVKVAMLLLFAVAGLFFVSPHTLSPSQWPPALDVFLGAGILFLAYQGFGLITNAAEDMRNPRQTLPRALYTSVGLVMVIYVLVSLAVVGNLPIPAIVEAKDYALAAAAKPFLGALGFRLIAVAALLSTSSAINATLYGGANVSYAIAKDGELPPFFERKVWGRGTEGLLITTGLVLLFANGFDLGKIAMMGSASFLVIYTAVNVAHLRLSGATGANRGLIWASTAGCLVFLAILLKHLALEAPPTLIALIILFALCFLGEWIYRGIAKRTLVTRSVEPDTGS